MKEFIRCTLLMSLIGFTLQYTASAQKTLPDVTVAKINGEKVNIADYGKNGKITIISFWATWCKPCKQELSNISEMYDEWQSKYNAELLAISIDDSRNLAKVRSYVAGQDWEYIVLWLVMLGRKK